MRSGSRSSLEGTGCCLLVVRSVHNKMMCPAHGQQKDDKKMADGVQAKMRAETKPKKTRVDRSEVVGFR